MSYYKIIDGIKMDGPMLTCAQEAATKNFDGKIYLEDAYKIFDAVQDDDIYTEVEKDTVSYILNHFSWNPLALEWFQKKLSGLRENEVIASMTAEEVAQQKFSDQDVVYTHDDQHVRKQKLTAAMVETNEDHDEIELIIRLANGKRVCVASNFIEVSGNHVQLYGGHIIPIHAIEKVII